jgi:threonine synthase
MLIESTQQPVRNPLLTGLQCMKCSAVFSLSFRQASCPTCRRDNVHVSLHARYSSEDAAVATVNLPYLLGFSLGEGNTPIISLPALAESLGLSVLEIKDESKNPSGSHKDRMIAMAINHALDLGAHTLVVGSAGRAAISTAFYAEAAGLKCEVASVSALPRAMINQLREWRAIVKPLESREALENFVEQRVQRRGYYALTSHQRPEIGSAPIAVDAYKAIAYECFSQAAIPEHVMVPTAKGDLAWGIFAGFRDLKKAGLIAQLPQIWIVEPFPRLSLVLAGASITDNFDGRSAQRSTFTRTVTFSQWQAAKETKGGAVAVDDYRAQAAQTTLKLHGIDADLSSAASLAAIKVLRNTREIRADALVMMILTAGSDE